MRFLNFISGWVRLTLQDLRNWSSLQGTALLSLFKFVCGFRFSEEEPRRMTV